jgi:hypothetical protein
MKAKFLFAALCLLLWNRADAVPLFGETAGTIQDGVLTLYKDDRDPHKVYFFPNSTRFSVDRSGVPLFNFAYWGLGNTAPGAAAGGYMTLTTHLAPDTDQQAALNNYIKNHPEMEVAVLPVKSSMVGLQTTVPNAQPLTTIFTEFNFSKVGGRAEDEIGVNAVLTPVGARVFKALLGKDVGGSHIKFDYCYVVQGFGPNMDAVVSVDMRRVYDYFETGVSGRWAWFSWDIKKVVEKLNEDHAVRVTMNGGDAKEWEVLNTIATTITARLFVPEIAASSVRPASMNQAFNFGAGTVHKEELKSETWNFVRRDLEDREFCTAIALKDLEGFQDKLVVNAD